MKFAYKNIKAFNLLLQNNSELFKPPQGQTLAENIPESTDIEEISESLLVWCQQRPEINKALRQVRRTLPDKKNKSRYVDCDDTQAQEEEQDEAYQIELLRTYINALRSSSPLEKLEPRTPKEKTNE